MSIILEVVWFCKCCWFSYFHLKETVKWKICSERPSQKGKSDQKWLILYKMTFMPTWYYGSKKHSAWTIMCFMKMTNILAHNKAGLFLFHKTDLARYIFNVGRLQIELVPQEIQEFQRRYINMPQVENRNIFFRYYVHMCSIVKVQVYARE